MIQNHNTQIQPAARHNGQSSFKRLTFKSKVEEVNTLRVLYHLGLDYQRIDGEYDIIVEVKQ